MTSKNIFLDMAAECRPSGGIVPVWSDCLLDLATPVSTYAKLRDGGFSFLLESAPAGSETWARYTLMGSAPYGAWRCTDNVVEEWAPGQGWHVKREVKDPIADLQEIVQAMHPQSVPELEPFWGGAVGFFSYDMVRHIEELPNAPKRALSTPDACFLFPRSVVVIDNWKAQARVIVSVKVPPSADNDCLNSLWEEALQTLQEVTCTLHGPELLDPLVIPENAESAIGSTSIEKADFEKGVARIKDYILAGDVFQGLLARRISTEHDFDGLTLYRCLRVLNPSPYMYHMELDGTEIVGSSPELLLRVANGRVTVRPIAGTRRRGTTAAADEALAAELLADEKERAEHVMLVDLGRNDVGRIAEYGSVAVTDLMKVERYSHVLHMVSQVEGNLLSSFSALDAFRATFPAGTMTGAPKIRAMEIIDELEPERRGPYAGALGYIAAGDKRMDMAITIRTCVIADGTANAQAGAGIVHDSVPSLEWEETESKARAILTAIGQARAARKSTFPFHKK